MRFAVALRLPSNYHHLRQAAQASFNRTSDLRKPREFVEWRPRALVGCKRGHIGKSASRAIATYSATSNDRLTSTPVFGRNAHIAVMSGRRPVVKGCFEATVNVSGAVMSTAC
jgi:hypothetical protein